MNILTKNQKKEKVKDEKEFPRNSVSVSRSSTSLIKQAWITEKAGDLSKLNKHIFIVDKKANKSEIRKAIEFIYGVKTADVNIINIKGKEKRLGRSLGRTSGFKKAIATLKKGHKIDIMPA